MDQSMLIDELLARVAAKLAAAEEEPSTGEDPAGEPSAEKHRRIAELDTLIERLYADRCGKKRFLR